MQENNSTTRISANFSGLQIEVFNSKMISLSILFFISILFFSQYASGKVTEEYSLPAVDKYGFLSDSTESSRGINLPNIEPKPSRHHNEANNIQQPIIPQLIFCLNDTTATEGQDFDLCATAPAEFSLCEIIEGFAPFTICFELDSDANCISGVEAGDMIFSEYLYPGNHTIQITSITDRKGNTLTNTESLNYTIQITTPPAADAGIDATICETTGLVLNSASAESYSSIFWEGGDGAFVPSTEVLNPMYQPGPNDIVNGTIEISLTATPTDPCNTAAIDYIKLSIMKNAESDAGQDITICEDQQYVELAGNIQNGLPIWENSNYTGGFFEDPLSTSTKYYFSDTDIELGTIQLCLLAIPAAPCVVPQSDCLEVTIIKSPDAFAGEDMTITDSEVVYLDEAMAENTTAVEWITNGDGTFSNVADVNATYFPGQDDIADGEVKLIITAMPEDGCTVNDMDLITIDIIQPETSNNPQGTTIDEGPGIYKSNGLYEEASACPIVVETNIFPNPASDFVNINSSETISGIRVMNTGGMQVMNQSVEGNSTTIQVSQLEQGMYILVIEFRDKTRTTRKITIR